MKKKQNINFLSNSSSDDDKYAVSVAVSKILSSAVKSIEVSEVNILQEV